MFVLYIYVFEKIISSANVFYSGSDGLNADHDTGYPN
jgi:hypothetical protein